MDGDKDGEKKHRVILIDPELRSIREFESACSYDEMHALIGTDNIGSFRIAVFEEDRHVDMGYVDDVGLSREKPIYAFLFPRAKDPIGGKCLIIGASRNGETASARLPLELLKQDISWLGLIQPEVVWDRGKDGVKRTIVTYSRIRPS